jgi:hypothetical protein
MSEREPWWPGPGEDRTRLPFRQQRTGVKVAIIGLTVTAGAVGACVFGVAAKVLTWLF